MTDTINFQDKANFIWQVADDILFGPFMHNEFRDVVLPFVVLRRLDCIYTDEIREGVQKSYRQFKDVFPSEDDLEPILLDTTAGLKFYNISDFNLMRLAGNAQAIEENFDFYLKSYSRNVRDILQNFKLEGVIAKLMKNNLLYQLVSKFTEIDLHPTVVKNHEMGYIYEHLLYKFNQFTGETAGHHYTPREVIRPMYPPLFSKMLPWKALAMDLAVLPRLLKKTPSSNSGDRLNQTYGANLTEDDKIDLERIRNEVEQNPDLQAVMTANNTEQTKREKFSEMVDKILLKFIHTKLDLYKKIKTPEVEEFIKREWFKQFRDQGAG
ncbi:MAG: type I restriction-modification system subunit M N-terminal domain-containing protein [Stenomitos frigidus ULC029]